MSGVSFDKFIDTARISGGGNIRFAKGDGDEVINKGGFGHSVASFFQSIGRGLGLMKPDPTLAQRQTDALDRFKEVLAGRFGDSVANAVLHSTGLDAPNATLTGRKVIAAADQAMVILKQNKQTHLSEMQKYLPPGQGEQPSQEFSGLAGRMSPPLVPATLSRDAAADFIARMRATIEEKSEFGRVSLPPDRIKEIAKETLKQVVKLERLGEVQDAARVQQEYVAAVKSVIVSIGRGEDPAKLLLKLEEMSSRYDALTKADRLGEPGGDEFRSMTERAMYQAIRELRAEHPGLAEKAQKKLLADGSSMLAVMKASRSPDVQNQHVRTNNQSIAVGQLYNVGAALVEGFQKAFGSVGTTSDTDADRLYDTPGVSKESLAAAKLAIIDLLGRTPPDYNPEKDLLAIIDKEMPGEIDTQELDRRVAELVRFREEEEGIYPVDTLHRLRDAAISFNMRVEMTEAVLAAVERAINK